MKPNGHGVVLYDPEVLVKSAFVRFLWRLTLETL
jgi:hypothetical protein